MEIRGFYGMTEEEIADELYYWHDMGRAEADELAEKIYSKIRMHEQAAI